MKHQFNRTLHIITPILVGKFSKSPPLNFEACDVSDYVTLHSFYEHCSSRSHTTSVVYQMAVDTIYAPQSQTRVL